MRSQLLVSHLYKNWRGLHTQQEKTTLGMAPSRARTHAYTLTPTFSLPPSYDLGPMGLLMQSDSTLGTVLLRVMMWWTEVGTPRRPSFQSGIVVCIGHRADLRWLGRTPRDGVTREHMHSVGLALPVKVVRERTATDDVCGTSI